jgi:ABC-type Fe3+-hydroxamate transport system substrate-binding protein
VPGRSGQADAHVDDAGRTLVLAAPPRRIVSLVPSLTELLFELGAGETVIGVTRYCTEPPHRIAPLPKLGGTKNPDLEAVVALAPDLVVMNAEENRREDFETLASRDVPVYVTEPKTVAEGVRLVARLGALVGRTEIGARLASAQQAALDATLARVERHLRGVAPVRYFCPIWRKPWMAFNADTYAHDVLAVAGGANVVAEHAVRYPEVTLDAIAVTRPEVVLLPDEPYRFTARDVPALAALDATPALRGGHVRFVDGKALAWYGLRIADAVATFARVLAEARPADA